LSKPSLTKPKKVLILGSGALKIGEAGEFDYSGSQAIKALKEEGVKVILINPNIATNQTSKGLADKIYFLPINAEFVEKVIAKEKPDGLLLSFGGQSALNCGVELYDQGLLKKHKLKVLGTSIETIKLTEDRELFNKELNKIGINVPKSIPCVDKKSALKAAEKIGYPVIIRAAFALGGKGSGCANNKKELDKLLDSAFAFSPQVLVEENLSGWKEIEYEVIRDSSDNCVTVCNMENFDPLGIHTGESIVIAPSQTLNNHEYHKLREIGIKVIRHFQIVGECNIQYALDPKSDNYRVIEVNARLSRSSALASKATGYPLAYIAAKLALGYKLTEIKNSITKCTSACFEPALDYVALKIPRWDLDKFRKVSKQISTEMKSVGEIMALGRSFEEVIQKGLRMLQIGFHGLVANEILNIDSKNLENEIKKPTPKRIIAVAQALQNNWSVEKINQLSGIDCWFLYKLKNIIETERELANYKNKKSAVNKSLLLRAKKQGFSDRQIGSILGQAENEIRTMRKKFDLIPYVKQIDTLAAEYPASTNYLYLTYHATKDDISFKSKKKKAIVLGSGPYCIGSSVEFDLCCVNCVKTLQKENFETIMINYNPETVSTDYDICDKLYFDELSLERVLDIYEKENPYSVVVSMGGQIPNNLVMKLYKEKVKIFGTDPKNIHKAESRNLFSKLLDNLNIDQPEWKGFSDIKQAFNFAKKVGYPVLVRPSYVLSGAAMSVAQNEADLQNYLMKAAKISTEAPVVISKFLLNAKEIEFDGVAYKGELIIYTIGEHVENAGVHSGDATIIMPPQKIYLETIRRIKQIAKKIAKGLEITGPFNIQLIAKNNDIKVIECNLRASRSFPFSSKVTGHDLIDIATKAFLGKVKPKTYRKEHYQTLDLDHVAVKAPQFSFSRLKGADPVLGVEMASTGEVACFGDNLEEAFLKAMISVGFKIPRQSILLSIGKLEDKADFINSAKTLTDMGFKLYATKGTHELLNQSNIKTTLVYKAQEKQSPNLLKYLQQKKFDLVINVPRNYSHEEVTAGYLIRRAAIDLNIPLITNLQVAKLIVKTLKLLTPADIKIKSWDEYV